jgi:hypothetical protein
MTMQLIETKTLETAAASIEFTSIPQDGTDLLLLTSSRSNRASVGEYVVGSFNSDTSNYAVRLLSGSGSAASSSTFTTGAASRILTYSVGNTGTSNTFANSEVYIPNYAGSTNKSYSGTGVMENNATLSIQELAAGLWSNTAAITSLTLTPLTGTLWLTGTVMSLYKITKGSGGATVS